MNEEKEITGSEETVENIGANNATETKKLTFDELLASDKDYQSEYDKKVSTAMNSRLENERKKWELEQRNKLEEAEKLAKMDADQKKDYQLQEALKRANEAESKLSARDLEAETLKQADRKEIPLELISTIDFTKETAESISSKLEIFEKTAKTVREKAIDEYSREKAPMTGDKVDTTETPKSYKEWDEYYKKHPNAN